MIFGIAVITLLILLAVKELASAIDLASSQRIASFLTLPILPLIVLFVLIVALTMAKVLELDLLKFILSP